MSAGDPEDVVARKTLVSIEEQRLVKNNPVTWTEAQLYEKAFEGETHLVSLDLLGKSIVCDNVLDGGAEVAAVAIMAIALTENLSLESRATLRQIYDALNPDAGRGQHRLTLKHRKRGKKPQSIEEQHRERLNDNVTATLVRIATNKFGKKEAAVHFVATLQNVSRASIFRALARSEACSAKAKGE
jgi:hypothetical protein